MTRSRTVRGSVLALAAAFVMSSCAAHPGSAAVVGSESISSHEVDDVASALCSAQGSSQQPGQAAQQLASRAARQGALDVLIKSSLSRQFGESQGVVPDQARVSAAVAANAQNISSLPVEDRAVFRRTLGVYAEAQLMLVEIGRRELARTGAQNITEQQALAEGTKLRNAWAGKHAEVSVDPRFGVYSQDALLHESGSLSVAQSATATDGGSPDPSQGWVASLPASQKCS